MGLDEIVGNVCELSKAGLNMNYRCEKVDDYPPAIKHWSVPPSTDTRLNNPKWIYFGRNGKRCVVFRLQFRLDKVK